MGQKLEGAEPLVITARVIIPFSYYAGSISNFFIELRDNRKVMGLRCPSCNRVYVPPRPNCARCFVKLEEWVEVSNRGTLIGYTIVHYPSPVHPVESPFAYGNIQLDGADTGLLHILSEVRLESISIGMKVEAVFREKRDGDILDIRYFKPL